MALNDTPSKLESVFIQRDQANQFYEQINISGSDLIIFHSSSGVLTAEKIPVFLSRYGGGLSRLPDPLIVSGSSRIGYQGGNGGTITATGTGLITNIDWSGGIQTVTGSGTHFLAELQEGDHIWISGDSSNWYTILSIIDDATLQIGDIGSTSNFDSSSFTYSGDRDPFDYYALAVTSNYITASAPVLITNQQTPAWPYIPGTLVLSDPVRWTKIGMKAGLSFSGQFGFDANGLSMNTNAWYNGQWNADDVSKPSFVIIEHMTNRQMEFRVTESNYGSSSWTADKWLKPLVIKSTGHTRIGNDNGYGGPYIDIGPDAVLWSPSSATFSTITASFVQSTASWAINVVNVPTVGGSGLGTGSTYPITASAALSASMASSSSYEFFNGNRGITRSGYTGINLGTNNVVDFLNAFFFPFSPASISINSGTTYYETGSAPNVGISGNVTANSETVFGSGSVRRNGKDWYTFTSASSYSTTDLAISGTNTYQTYMQVGNNGSPTLINSSTKTYQGVFPYLYGMSTTPGLAGTSLYTTLTGHDSNGTQRNLSENLVGTSTYVYFAYPVTYTALSSIKDWNNFETIGSYDYSASVPVTSSGLTNNWMMTYRVYRWTLQANPGGLITFTHS